MAPASIRMQYIGKLIKYYLMKPNIFFGDRPLKTFKRLINEETIGSRRNYSKKLSAAEKAKAAKQAQCDKDECQKIIAQAFVSGGNAGIQDSCKKTMQKQRTQCNAYLKNKSTCASQSKPAPKPKPPPRVMKPCDEFAKNPCTGSACIEYSKASLCSPKPACIRKCPSVLSTQACPPKQASFPESACTPRVSCSPQSASPCGKEQETPAFTYNWENPSAYIYPTLPELPPETIPISQCSKPKVRRSCNVVHATILVATRRDLLNSSPLPRLSELAPSSPSPRKRSPCDRLLKGYPNNLPKRDYSTYSKPLRMYCTNNLVKVPYTQRNLYQQYYGYPLLSSHKYFYDLRDLRLRSNHIQSTQEYCKPDYVALYQKLLPQPASAMAIMSNMFEHSSCFVDHSKSSFSSQRFGEYRHFVPSIFNHNLASNSVLMRGFEPWVPIPSVGFGVTQKKPEFPCPDLPNERPKKQGPCSGNQPDEVRKTPCKTPPPCLGEPKRFSGVDSILGYLNGFFIKIYNIGSF